MRVPSPTGYFGLHPDAWSYPKTAIESGRTPE